MQMNRKKVNANICRDFRVFTVAADKELLERNVMMIRVEDVIEILSLGIIELLGFSRLR